MYWPGKLVLAPSVCLAVEDGQGDILDHKHRKNMGTLTMMNVSRSWRDTIVRFDDLFGDITFDTSNGCTIVTMARVLLAAKTRATELWVFIRSNFHDLTGNTRLQVIAKDLLHRLGQHSGRFTHFELQSLFSHLNSHFNLPAPKLHFLRHDCATPPILFSSSFPNLRTLYTHVNKTIGILPSTLSNLVELHLTNSRRTQRFSMKSVLDLLRNTHQLEVLQLSGFTQFGCASTIPEPVELNRLKSVQFTDCHLPELLPRLCFPQLRKFSFCGPGFSPDENTPPTVSNTDFFSPLQAYPLPILDQ